MSTVLGPDIHALAQGASALLAWMGVEVQARSRELGVEHVLFMTREGILFKDYFERFQPSASATPTAQLLRVSRLSTFAASLHGQGPAGLQRLFTQYPQAGWPQLLASLGEPVDPLPKPPPAAAGQALGQAIAADPVLAAWLEQVVARKRAELAAYLDTWHADALRAGRVLVVDVGWRGTIQDNLALTFPQLAWDGLYIGLFPFMNPQPPNVRKHGLLFDPANAGGAAGDNVMLVEYLFHQAVGTVAGYRDGSAHTLDSADREDTFSAAFQAAVLADAPRRAAQWARQPGEATLAGWRQESLAFWSGCQRMPLALLQAVRGYAHEETFGLGQVFNMAEAMSPRAALRSLLSRRERALFLQYVGSLPLALRHEAGLGLWLRAWLHVRHAWRWLRSLGGS